MTRVTRDFMGRTARVKMGRVDRDGAFVWAYFRLCLDGRLDAETREGPRVVGPRGPRRRASHASAASSIVVPKRAPRGWSRAVTNAGVLFAREDGLCAAFVEATNGATLGAAHLGRFPTRGEARTVWKLRS